MSQRNDGSGQIVAQDPGGGWRPEVVVETSASDAGTALTTGAALALTTAATALPSQACRMVVVMPDPANTANVLLGNGATQVFPLAPGQMFGLPLANANLISLKMASGTGTAYWVGVT